MSQHDRDTTNPDHCPADLVPFLSELLDGRLTDQQRSDLQDLLRDSAACRRYYLRYQHVHAAAQWTLGQARPDQRTSLDHDEDAQLAQPTDSVDAFLDMLAALDDPSGETVPIDLTDLLAKQKRARREPMKPQSDGLTARKLAGALAYLGSRPAVWGPIAAMLAIAATLFITLNGPAPQPTANNDTAPNTPNAPAALTQLTTRGSTPVATLTDTHNAVWSSPQAEGASAPGSRLTPGSKLHPGQRLTLTAGFAEITTNRGAIAILEAPATIELLDNDNAIRLHAGKLVGICETESSKGFIVRTPHMDITDLGTRFGVDASIAHQTRAHVFEGEVAVVSSSASGGQPSARLLEGESASVAVGSAEVVRLKNANLRFVQDIQAFMRQPEVTGSVRFEPSSPTDLRLSRFEADEIVVFNESRSKLLERDTTVAVAALPTGPKLTTTQTVKAGTRVDSYLVHFDIPGSLEQEDGLRRSGTIRFDRPVLGLIIDARALQGTHQNLGMGGVAYPGLTTAEGNDIQTYINLQTSSTALNDRFMLTPDRRTLTLDLYGANNFDQVRVLVQAEETIN